MQFTLTLSPSLYRGEPPDILGPAAGRAVVDMLQVGTDHYYMSRVPTYHLHPLALGHRVEQGGLRGHLAPAHNNRLSTVLIIVSVSPSAPKVDIPQPHVAGVRV